jgi:RNA polymerase sigma-70 factor, ECF subfamily
MPARHAQPPPPGSASGMSPRELDPRTLTDHIDRLYRAAWALCGRREDAEDLVQETFVRVLKRPRVLRGGDDLAYLLRVLRNVFLDQYRASTRHPRVQPLEDVEVTDPREADRPDRALEAREVYRLVAALPDDFRDVVVAVDVVGLSYEEASKSLKVPPGTVMSRLHRGRERVARELRQAPA